MFANKEFLRILDKQIQDSFEYEKKIGKTTETGEYIDWQFVASIYASDLCFARQLIKELLEEGLKDEY